jgi:hypothetical protein
MTYIIDTSSLIVCGHYFPSRFPTFWEQFDELIESGDLLSVREVRNELDNQASKPHLRKWIDSRRHIFLIPSPEETQFVAEIFSKPHFQQLISQKQRLVGKPVADPFVIAAARCRNGTVVTEEKNKPNAARIPNVCNHFGVDCISIEDLMETENWEF